MRDGRRGRGEQAVRKRNVDDKNGALSRAFDRSIPLWVSDELPQRLDQMNQSAIRPTMTS